MTLHIDSAWEQGALLSPADLSDIPPAQGEVFIIISQSCDVVYDSFDAEPLVEVHLARVISELNGGYTHGKHPRMIDLEETIDGKVRRYRICDADRQRLDRRLLQKATPLATLSPDVVRTLANWTSRRFVRPALPDEFNRRRKPVERKVSKIAARYAHDIAAFFVILNEDRELDPAEAYEIFLIGTVRAEIATDATRFQQAAKAVAELAEALNANGISVVEAMAKSEEQISLTDVRAMIRLELDYISVREGMIESTPGEA
jgi:hypothetical protein